MNTKEIFSRIWNAYERGELVAKCAWCGRIRIDDTWLPPPLAALAAIDEANALSHSICESCFHALELEPKGAVPQAG
jgi:hypothetical protein